MRDIIDKLKYENELKSQGFSLIAGVDEVGRGPLAGPVVCASVIMPLDDIIEGIDDSKKLSEKKREILFDKIMKPIFFMPHYFGLIDSATLLPETRYNTEIIYKDSYNISDDMVNKIVNNWF